MTKLSLLSLPVLTAIAVAGGPAMTSQAAMVRTYRIPAGAVGSSNGSCNISGKNNQLNHIIQSAINGNGSSNQFCENWNKPDCGRPELPGGGAQDGSVDAYAARVLELVNEERARVGAGPLTLDVSAQAAAETRAKEITASFSHTRPNGSSFSTALAEAGVTFRASGENIAYGQKSPEAVMAGWMNSSGHRANILNESFTSIGIGHARDGAGVDYWTQLFFN